MIIYYVCRLPGHDGGGLWPPWISSHYSVRTSQHLLDPYTLAHVRYRHSLDISTYLHIYISTYLQTSHGALSFAAALLLGLDPGLGLLLTAAAAVVFEMGENSALVVETFRQNSGASAEYEGDRWVVAIIPQYGLLNTKYHSVSAARST